MKPGKTVLLLIAVLLAIANIGAWFGMSHHLWPANYSLYFFGAESLAAGIFVLLMFSKHLLVFFAVLGLTAYATGFNNFLFMNDYKIPLSFWGFYSLFWLIYFQIRNSELSHRIRLLHPFQQMFFYLAYMAFSIASSFALTSYFYFGVVFVPAMHTSLMHQLLGMAVGIPTLTIIILKIVNMIGEKHVLYFLLGTYHHPIEVKRIVLFLDMVGSSAAAEKLSPAKSMEMIARFIFDASLAFRSHGGDIVNYTGDGLVVLWSIHRADSVIRAIDMLERRLARHSSVYESRFGIVPGFRVGIHAGSVVMSQIGEEKLFLGVYGDVLNTASRIEALNKEKSTRILMSKAFKHYLGLEMQKRIRPMGTAEVRGREESVEIFTLAG